MIVVLITLGVMALMLVADTLLEWCHSVRVAVAPAAVVLSRGQPGVVYADRAVCAGRDAARGSNLGGSWRLT
jgi:hypothetical protein